jgi:oxygen-independent coproporphyrinogen-3 oxidase
MVFPRQNIIPRSSIPNSFIKVLMAESADRLLVKHDYIRLGLDHYIKKDDPFLPDLQKNGSKTLMGYSQSNKLNYLGFGATAISFFDRTFYRNVSSIEDYYRLLDDNLLPVAFNRSYRHNDDDRIRSTLILDHILTRFKVDISAFEKSFDISFKDYFHKEYNGLRRFEDDGLVDLQDRDIIRITRAGQYFSRHIANLFDRFYKQPTNHS